jgi:hypothetical protein
MVFGRKGVNQPTVTNQQVTARARQWAEEHFRRDEKPGSMGYAQHLGKVLFDATYKIMAEERGARIENLLAALASVGGHLCLVAVLEQLRTEGLSPADIGMAVARGADGNTYYFGDAPNYLLCEAQHSLISLVFGAAHEHGAPVSLEMLHQEMGRVAAAVGSPEFLEMDLPADHQVDTPLSWAHVFTPRVVELLSSGGAPAFWRPTIVGFALQQAIDVGRETLEPLMQARISLACAVRAAKLDPERVRAG